MVENDCLSDAADWIGLDFVERERIPSEIIEKVFVVILPFHRFRIQLRYSMVWVSDGSFSSSRPGAEGRVTAGERCDLCEEHLSYRVQLHGHRNQIERVFRDGQRRTSSFSNCFSRVDPPTAERWLQAHAVWWKRSYVTPAGSG